VCFILLILFSLICYVLLPLPNKGNGISSGIMAMVRNAVNQTVETRGMFLNNTQNATNLALYLGEIMKVGYTFACFMRKKIVFSQVIQLPTYKSIFFI
jgi:hypothetical protein